MLGDVRTGGGGSGESLGDDSGVWFLSGSSNWPEVLTLEALITHCIRYFLCVCVERCLNTCSCQLL